MTCSVYTSAPTLHDTDKLVKVYLIFVPVDLCISVSHTARPDNVKRSSALHVQKSVMLNGPLSFSESEDHACHVVSRPVILI